MKNVEILSKYLILNILFQGDKLVAKRVSEKFKRIKGSTLAKLLNGINFGESVYNWKGNNQEEFKLSDMINGGGGGMINDNESVYSMRTDATQQTSVTVATDQLGITVRRYIFKYFSQISED